MGVIGLWAGPLQAQDTTGQDEAGSFTFKRMAVPTPGATRRITVQIDPLEQARRAAADRARAEALALARAEAEAARSAETAPDGEDAFEAPAPLPFAWFWNDVAPERENGGPANLARALTALDGAVDFDPPRLQDLQNIAAEFGPQILMSTIGTDVSPALVVALISVESAGRVKAESEAGAQGLMQLIPDTAARFGVKDPTDPAQNIKGGTQYLGWLLDTFDRDAILALAGYNAGENAVISHGGVPPYPETRAYVPKVLNAWRIARGLCLTPPELITDGCVFAVNGT